MYRKVPYITIQQMVVFVTVVEENGFLHAAQKLHMTQSAVSKSVARLENELGIRLFHRSTRYLELTEAGNFLYEDWKIHLSAFQNSYQHALGIENRHNSAFRIGLMNTARPEGYFYSVAEKMKTMYPDVHVEVESQYMTDLVTGLEEGVFDVIALPDFTRFSVEQKKLAWRYLACDTTRVIMSAHHPLAKRKEVITRDLLDMKFVAVSTFQGEDDYIRDLAERLAPYGSTPEIAHIYKTAYDIRYLFRPDDAVLVVDAYFDFPEDTQDFVILPVTDQKNGVICAWDPDNDNQTLKKFLKLLPEETV